MWGEEQDPEAEVMLWIQEQSEELGGSWDGLALVVRHPRGGAGWQLGPGGGSTHSSLCARDLQSLNGTSAAHP